MPVFTQNKEFVILKNNMSNLPPHPRYNGVQAISWSDLIAIESNVATWYKRATGVMDKRESPAMAFGTHVHNMIERGKLKLKGVPKGESPEETIVATIKYKKGGKSCSFEIVGTLDDIAGGGDIILEYKTGRLLWSQQQANDHGQLRTYALLRKSVTGKAPTRALLISLETANDEDAGIYLTGERRVLTVEITALEILKIQARFIAAYEKASDYIDTL